jgi:small subunit ribosomal protein S16
MGNTNRPFYRIVAIDSRMRRDGRSVEELGWYDPLKPVRSAHLEEETILEWLQKGAEPSATVRELLRERGLLLKWQLVRQGVTAAEATRRVAEALAAQKPKSKKTRLSKKAQAKAGAAATAS